MKLLLLTIHKSACRYTGIPIDIAVHSGANNRCGLYLGDQAAKRCTIALDEEDMRWYREHCGHLEVHHDAHNRRILTASKAISAARRGDVFEPQNPRGS